MMPSWLHSAGAELASKTLGTRFLDDVTMLLTSLHVCTLTVSSLFLNTLNAVRCHYLCSCPSSSAVLTLCCEDIASVPSSCTDTPSLVPKNENAMMCKVPSDRSYYVQRSRLYATQISVLICALTL